MDEIPENFFICEEYTEYTENICGISQTFFASPAASTDYDLTGQVLWPGAKYLAEYLLSHKELIENKLILEVGAGSGLCGLACSHFASKTILTDGNEIVMRLLEKNKNFGKNIEVLMLEWNDNDPKIGLCGLGLSGEFELIIGADVVYWSESIVPLFKTIGKVLSDNGKFYMCYTARANNTYRDLLMWSSDAGFANELLWSEESTYIYAFFKKSQ